jgi:hypothetical protein
MNQSDLIKNIITTYRKHGWQLMLVLLRPETRAEVTGDIEQHFIRESDIDALWFSRPSHANREAWELRLLSETPYALFETFEAEKGEEARELMRQKMEVRLREHVGVR